MRLTLTNCFKLLAALPVVLALAIPTSALAGGGASSAGACSLKLVVHRGGNSSSGDHKDISAIVGPQGIEWTSAGPNFKQIVFCEVRGTDTNGKRWKVTGHPQGGRHRFSHGATIKTAVITARLK